MTQSSESSFRSRILLLVPVIALGVLSIFATGGGGGGDNNGGGGGGTGDVPPTVLTSYNFEIGSVVPQSQGGLDVEASEFTVTVDFGDTILGSVNLDVGANSQVTFLSYVVYEGSDFSITVSRTQTALDGTFTVAMTADLSADLNAPPTSGTFDVVTGDGTATVNVVANGVELSLDGGAATFYTWDDYDNILDDPMAEAWQLRAALAGGAMQFIFEQMFAVADQLDQLEASVDGPIATSCDMFGGTPPDGVLAQGENVLTWLGATSADSMLGSIFDWNFTDCWTSDNDQLANGLIQFQNYIEEVNADNVLVRIGFGPSVDMDGGIVFVDWILSDTADNQGVYTIDHSGDLTVSGGFSLLFEAM